MIDFARSIWNLPVIATAIITLTLYSKFSWMKNTPVKVLRGLILAHGKIRWQCYIGTYRLYGHKVDNKTQKALKYLD